jgi:hypothetical protein
VAATEGTIHFAYNLTPQATPLPEFSELAAWRDILFRLDLIGQHPDKYEGFAFGNLSAKSADQAEDDDAFVITASQTSGALHLDAGHLVTIREANLSRFWVEAEGVEPPSSETLTHAMIYQADIRARSVLHIHNAEIWHHRAELNLPETPESVSYGTQAMVSAVAELLDQHQSRPLVFATAGHKDGIFVLGTHLRDCGGLLVSYYAKALALALALDLDLDQDLDLDH